jgi:hypothetical protein
MANQNITTQTPIRLYEPVCKAFAEAFSAVIEEHGASYAVNKALADYLRKKGFWIPELETPKEKISKGQRERWGSVKAVVAEAQEKLEAQREAKRERDRRYRAKKKAAGDPSPSEE